MGVEVVEVIGIGHTNFEINIWVTQKLNNSDNKSFDVKTKTRMIKVEIC